MTRTVAELLRSQVFLSNESLNTRKIFNRAVSCAESDCLYLNHVASPLRLVAAMFEAVGEGVSYIKYGLTCSLFNVGPFNIEVQQIDKN